MAYDELLAKRYRDAPGTLPRVTQKRMMGGVCFFLHGNMIGGADREKGGRGRFMFRVGKESEAKALKRPGAEPVILGERRMDGMVFVDADACDQRALGEWAALALDYARALPPKRRARTG